MFSSYPYPHLTCSSNPHGHVFPPSDENYLLLNQRPFCDPASAVAPSPFIIDNAACSTSNKAAATAMDNQDFVSWPPQLKGDPHCDPLDSVIVTKKSTTRKNRHSKIFTAQGLRGRRVRLSIEIARKFFNLQDKLGFDKPSETLNWLFTNSKTAIQELVKMKDYNLSSSSTSSECELNILTGTKRAVEQIEGAQELLISRQNPVLIGSSGKDKKIRAHTHKPAALHLLAKESREKARARARERTQEKQLIRELDEFKKQIPDHRVTSNNYPILYHSIWSSNEIGIPSSKVSAESLSPQIPGISLVNYEASWKDIIVEAILTKKPLQKSSPIYDYQENLAAPEEVKFRNQLFSQI